MPFTQIFLHSLLITSKCFITAGVGMVRAIRCHRQNTKTNIINSSEVSRLSVAIQINRGEITFNGKEDKVHVIAGYVFLPVPGIFFDYLKATGSSDDREKVQASFEQLNLHKRRDNRRFYFAQLFDTPDKSGKFKRMKGYLVKSRQVFRKTIPQDSQFLLFP